MKVLVLVGILKGIVCLGAVMIIAGAIFRTVVRYAIEVLTGPARGETPSDKALIETKTQ